MTAQVVSEVGHILLLVSILAWLGRVTSGSIRGAIIGFALGAFLSVLPMEYSPQYFIRSAIGDLSMLSWLLSCHLLLRSVYGATLISGEQLRVIAVVTLIGGLLIYPASLGAPFPDFYRLGFDSSLVILPVAAGSLVYLLGGRFLIGLWAALAMTAFGLRLLESLNFWDCLFDYPSFFVSFVVLMKQVFKRRGQKEEISDRA